MFKQEVEQNSIKTTWSENTDVGSAPNPESHMDIHLDLLMDRDDDDTAAKPGQYDQSVLDWPHSYGFSLLNDFLHHYFLFQRHSLSLGHREPQIGCEAQIQASLLTDTVLLVHPVSSGSHTSFLSCVPESSSQLPYFPSILLAATLQTGLGWSSIRCLAPLSQVWARRSSWAEQTLASCNAASCH